MLRSILIGVAAAGLLIAGALSGLASNSHGTAVSRLATGTTLKGDARGDAISTLARAAGRVATVAPTSTSAAPTNAQAETDSDTAEATDEDANDATDADDAADQAGATATDENDAHGDAVSAVAKSEASAAHEKGKKQDNHGGAVSEAAEKD